MVSKLTQKYPNEIVSFILFGSATTGEWVQGKSDIDCIVITNSKEFNKEVEEYLNFLLLELDKKYVLNLADTCTPYKKTDNLALNFIFKTEKTMMFGRPFYVVSEEQLDIKNFKVRKDIKIEIGTRTIASIALFLQRIKNTGVVLYGRDIKKEIPEVVPTIEKIKASFNAMLLLMMSYVIFPFSLSVSFSHAIKANFWACDDVLFALEHPLSTTKQEIEEICIIFDRIKIDTEHLYKSLEYKKSKETMNLNQDFVIRYILKSTKFVYGLYWNALKEYLKR